MGSFSPLSSPLEWLSSLEIYNYLISLFLTRRHHMVVKYSKMKFKYWLHTKENSFARQNSECCVALLCSQDVTSHHNLLTVSDTMVQNQNVWSFSAGFLKNCFSWRPFVLGEVLKIIQTFFENFIEITLEFPLKALGRFTFVLVTILDDGKDRGEFVCISGTESVTGRAWFATAVFSWDVTVTLSGIWACDFSMFWAFFIAAWILISRLWDLSIEKTRI